MIAWQTIGIIAQLLFSSALVGVILLHRREGPKAKALAKKIEAATDSLEADTDTAIWGRFQKEITRLEDRLEKAESRIVRVEEENEGLRETVSKQRARERCLEEENTALREHIVALELRLSALENLFKAVPMTAEMQEAIAALDKTAPPRRRRSSK